ncbi:hypothetical protein Tsubulata_008873 [Turnera subulata]|uniref:Transmembrane protein n=1 Tax=Turnera subulata TaxID=218843 RepID=A0A9Q0FRL4_9ROSI|nr:hypothetical protein Tsubulata_008873 [Turnera subulata]
MEGPNVTELNDWEQIQTPTDQAREWQMVLLTNNNSSSNNLTRDHPVLPKSFPPPPPESLTPESPSRDQPTSDASTCDKEGGEIIRSDSKAKAGSEVAKLLRTASVWIGSRVRYYVVSRSGFCSFALVTFVAGLVLLYSRVRRWRQWLKEENNRLILIVKEKDQKIKELLDQIAQLKKNLSSRHKIPVIRVR